MNYLFIEPGRRSALRELTLSLLLLLPNLALAEESHDQLYDAFVKTLGLKTAYLESAEWMIEHFIRANAEIVDAEVVNLNRASFVQLVRERMGPGSQLAENLREQVLTLTEEQARLMTEYLQTEANPNDHTRITAEFRRRFVSSGAAKAGGLILDSTKERLREILRDTPSEAHFGALYESLLQEHRRVE